MNRVYSIVAFTALASLGAVAVVQPEKATVTPYFTPGDLTTAAVCDSINDAAKSVHVMAYSFTSAPIADALCEAGKRGVDVKIIVDSDSVKGLGSKVEQCRKNCFVYSDDNHAIQHQKTMVIDGRMVIAGSFNWSGAAQFSNSECCLLIESGGLAKRFEDVFAKHLSERKTERVK